MTTHSRRSLGRVLEDFGPTLLDLIHGDPDIVEEIGGVVIHDPHDEPQYPPHAVVLGPAVHGPAEIIRLLRTLGAHDVAALIVRGPLEPDPAVATAAGQAGVALLALTRGASWAQLAALLRTLLTEGDIGEAGAQTLGGIPSGDLFALANAVATLLDAPVTIEDRRSHVLAFSGRQDEADPSRVATILNRRVPEEYLRIMAARGVFKELYRSREPVFFAPATLDEGELGLFRVAIVIRAGDEILGSIWAAVHEPLSPERAAAFREAAELAALHLLRHRAGADFEHRLRADLVTTVLGGGPGAVDALDRLGLVHEPTVVLALGLAPGTGEDHAQLTAERQRLAGALAIHLNAVQPRSAVALLGDVAYAVLPAPGDPADGRERTVQIATNFLERTGDRVKALIGIGSVAKEPAALRRSRTNADRALRVLAGGHVNRRVASISDVYIDALLLEVRDLAVANGDELAGPLARLVAYDAKHNTSLVETLRAWLDAFGDVTTASASMFVHPNTFRYRMRRMTEVGRIDLQDPAARFAVQLQLRLMSPRPSEPTRDLGDAVSATTRPEG
ncbi:PucR family transcriptional regulator [Embleya scabrispora]|uniref:PucR family transcriptional regulator n=1 Tax=Embleya scabrispora TaxID=159449 RepID=UPI000365532A|nr:helix-turn-helix domain-containing protein [Embleya scabrispora]MYS84895.1 PucR family transcriptional regulator [Streptomyces sp. SID5474]